MNRLVYRGTDNGQKDEEIDIRTKKWMDWCIEGQRWTAWCIERQRDDQIAAQTTKRCIGWCI